MNECDVCHRFFKTAQGLAGHKRFSHSTKNEPDDLFIYLNSDQLYRKIKKRLTDKITDSVVDAIIGDKMQAVVNGLINKLVREGFDFNSVINTQQICAIIVAAGENKKLLPLTANKPGCLLEVGNKSLIDRQIEIFRSYGINDIVIIRGYQGNKINYGTVHYYDNPAYNNTGILKSLFSAEEKMRNAFIFCYSDIIYSNEIINTMLYDQSDISLVIDVDWHNNRLKGNQNRVLKAELASVEGNRISQIVTKAEYNAIPDSKIHGEFIGLAKFSKKGAEILVETYHSLKKHHINQSEKSVFSPEKASFVDLIQEVISNGYSVNYIDIHGGWAEIDTIDDYKRISSNVQLFS